MARESLGVVVASALKHRLADLRAAASLMDLPVGRPRILDDSSGLRAAVDLADGFQLFLASNHRKNPIDASGRVDWPRVTRVRVLCVEKTDDQA